MKRKACLVSMFVFFLIGGGWGYFAEAQTNLDSLWNIWQDDEIQDTTRLQALHKYAWDGYLFSQPDSAFHYAQIQYGFASKKGLKKSMANALTTQGASFWVKGDYPKSIIYFSNSLSLFEEIGDKKGIASSVNNLGNIYFSQGDHVEALTYYQRGLIIKQEIGDVKGSSTSLNNIGNLYSDQGDFINALKYHQESLGLKEQLGDKKGIVYSLNNIGIIYIKQGNSATALEFFSRALKISEDINEINGIAHSLQNIGNLHSNQGEYEKALSYLEKSLSIREETKDLLGIASIYNSLGSIHNKKEEFLKSIQECENGYALALKIGALDQQRIACQCLYNGYKALGNGDMALLYHEKMLLINDSLNADEVAKQLMQMEFQKKFIADSLKQEVEKLAVQNAHESEVRKKNKTKNIFLGSGLLLLLLAGGLYSRNRYIKKSKDVIEKEKDRSDNLLLNILPAEIAEELKINGKSDAREFDLVSILFTDFKEFTQTSEKLSAKELVSEINDCFEAFDSICGKYKVEKIKTIGDAYMAAGGLPVPSDDAVKNTILAALEMQDFIEKRIIENQKQNKPAFEMRVGIHTGPVVAGIVGVKKFQYDIWGDTVNTASRIESSGEVGKVNISQATHELIEDDPAFVFESRGEIDAKGKGEIEMYFVNLKTEKDY